MPSTTTTTTMTTTLVMALVMARATWPNRTAQLLSR